MALENGTLSAADVAAVTNGNNGWFGDGGGSFWIIILFLFLMSGFTGNGFGGGYGYGGGGAVSFVQDSVQDGFNQAAIMSGINGINTALSNAEVSRCNVQSNLTNQLNTIALNQATGLCNTNAQVADLKYTIATENCEDRAQISNALQAVNANVDDKVQGIMDKICQLELDAKNETIANLRSQNQALQFVASQTGQTAQIIANNDQQTATILADNAAQTARLQPVPVPAYLTPTPYNYGYNYGYGFNGNFGFGGYAA